MGTVAMKPACINCFWFSKNTVCYIADKLVEPTMSCLDFSKAGLSVIKEREEQLKDKK